MTIKDYGAGVSGYLDAEGRSWETTVFQAAKPVLDRELNLVEDAGGVMAQQGSILAHPSGWVTKSVLTSSDFELISINTTVYANRIRLKPLMATVNGWFIYTINSTRTVLTPDGYNEIDLGAGPVGAGAYRMDLVILEVWRKLITHDSLVGKSGLGKIFYGGNVKVSLTADDTNLNFDDDLYDPAVGTLTTKRVQIQHRLRVIQGVDAFQYPRGMDAPEVLARSVPPNVGTPDGDATVFPYVNQDINGDSGLWRAGDGTPSNPLGTVDGFMYAIPLCVVFRRNTTAFDKNSNHNGGVPVAGGVSDRPDGLFCDQIVARDVADLRNVVAPFGWDNVELLKNGTAMLLDNTLRTEWATTLIGGGYRGHTVLYANEIGISNAHGGDGVNTGDTPGAEFIGEFDGVRRSFSDRETYEIMTVRVTRVGGGNWVAGDVITLTPSALPVYPYSAYNWASYAPADVMFASLARANFLGGNVGECQTPVVLSAVAGFGSIPQGDLTLTLSDIPAGVTSEPIFIDIVVAYPPGLGLSRTPSAWYGAASLHYNTALPVGPPMSFDSAYGFTVDPVHREVFLEYQTFSHGITLASSNVVTDTIILPERLLSISAISIDGVPYAAGYTLAADGRSVLLLGAGTSPGQQIIIMCRSLRAFPQNSPQINTQVTIYYEARAPQALRDGNLGTNITVIPKYVSPNVWTLAMGSGAQDEAYPYPYAYVQTGGIYPGFGGTFDGEYMLDASKTIALSNFSAETGMLSVPTVLPCAFGPDPVRFDRTPGDVDIEGRSFFKAIPVSTYLPNAYAPPLSAQKTHKVVLPMIAELTANSTIGNIGQLVLVLLTRWASFDEVNGVWFDPTLAQSTTTASVFRLRGNPLNRSF